MASNDGKNGPQISRRHLAQLAAGAALAAGTSDMALAAHKPLAQRLNAEDRLAIQDLFSAFMWAYDCSDLSEWLSLFTDDALLAGRGTMFRGEEALTAWFQRNLKIRDTEGADIWMHENGQFRFEGSASPVVVYAYATHFAGKFGEGTHGDFGVRSLAYLVGECVDVKGAWKFRRFGIVPWDKSMLPWKKPLPWATA